MADAVCEHHLEVRGEWFVGSGSKAWRGPQVALTALLWDLCALPHVRIARHCNITVWTVTRHLEVHRRSVIEDREHAGRVSEITHEALALTIPA